VKLVQRFDFVLAVVLVMASFGLVAFGVAMACAGLIDGEFVRLLIGALVAANGICFSILGIFSLLRLRGRL